MTETYNPTLATLNSSIQELINVALEINTKLESKETLLWSVHLKKFQSVFVKLSPELGPLAFYDTFMKFATENLTDLIVPAWDGTGKVNTKWLKSKEYLES